MNRKSCLADRRWILCAIFCAAALQGLVADGHCFRINPQNVQAMAIYLWRPDFEINQPPELISFNVIDLAEIASIVSSIDFSVERDCSKRGALPEGIVYFRFTDGTIEPYVVFGKWSHISQVGIWGSCYAVVGQGKALLRNHAQ